MANAVGSFQLLAEDGYYLQEGCEWREILNCSSCTLHAPGPARNQHLIFGTRAAATVSGSSAITLKKRRDPGVASCGLSKAVVLYL
eukprot:scaffold599869_cov50-Prasinocladus_malaysianus.AAC.1